MMVKVTWDSRPQYFTIVNVILEKKQTENTVIACDWFRIVNTIRK